MYSCALGLAERSGIVVICSKASGRRETFDFRGGGGARRDARVSGVRDALQLATLLAQVLDAAQHGRGLAAGAEITVEANPGSADAERFVLHVKLVKVRSPPEFKPSPVRGDDSSGGIRT